MIGGSFKNRWWYSTRHTVGLGLIAVGIEMLLLCTNLRFSIPLGDLFILALTDAGLMTLFTFCVSAVLGGVLHRTLRKRPYVDVFSIHFGLVALLLAGVFFWPEAYSLYQTQRNPAVVALALCPVGFAGIVQVNARYGIRKFLAGHRSRIGFLPVCFLVFVGCVLISGLVQQQRFQYQGTALKGDASVLLVTVEGVDGESFFSKDAFPTERDQLTKNAVIFNQAVSPSPSRRPSHASLLTGLHPMRHKVVAHNDKLSKRYETLAERLRREGYVTGAFVSSSDLAEWTGFSQGFLTYDDDVSTRIAALSRLALLGGGIGVDLPFVVRRSSREAKDTIDRFERWIRRIGPQPYFGWVHIGSPSGEDADQDFEQVMSTILSIVDNPQRENDTLLVIAGAYGIQAVSPSHEVLSEEAIRVPLLVRGQKFPPSSDEVPAQVRLMDIPSTVLEYLDMDLMKNSEGVELVSYALGQRDGMISCPLVHWDWKKRSGYVGVRNNGVKYIRSLPEGDEYLFDLTEDPMEHQNLAGSQLEVLNKARKITEDLYDMLGGSDKIN